MNASLDGGNGPVTALSSPQNSAPVNWSEWRPKGQLIANLLEHTRPVNALAVSGDQRFFCSGSSDGSIRVWDSQVGLYRNLCVVSALESDNLAILTRLLCVAAFAHNRNQSVAIDV